MRRDEMLEEMSVLMDRKEAMRLARYCSDVQEILDAGLDGYLSPAAVTLAIAETDLHYGFCYEKDFLSIAS